MSWISVPVPKLCECGRLNDTSSTVMELVEKTSVAFGEKELVEIYEHTFFALSAAGYKPERVPISLNRIRTGAE
jgi:hypothetical protein